MSIVKIEKANIVLPVKLKEQVLDLLQEKGIVQVDDFKNEIINKYSKQDESETSETKNKYIDFEYLAAEAQFAINFLENFKEKEKKNLLEKLKSSGLLKINRNDFENTIKNFDYKKIIEECKSLEENINLRQNKIEGLKEEQAMYNEWEDLQINFSQGLETKNTNTLIGSIKTTDYDKLMDLLAKGNENFELQKISQNDDDVETKIIFIYLKNKEEYFKKILNQIDFKEVNFSELKSTIKNKIEELKLKITQYTEEKEQFVLKAKNLAKEQDKLKIIFDYYSARLEYKNTSQHVLDMNFVSVIQVWIPVKQLDNIKKDLEKISNQINIFKVEPEEGEKIPVALKNSNLIQPFESVTNIYGLPKANEVDPTWWLSLSFLIFFGFCLSDAGYGFFLAAVALLAIKILKIPREKQGMMRLMIYCGIFTFIIGAIFGGWFGINIDSLPPGFLGDTLRKIRLVNPMEDPLTVMYAAFALGFAHILWGIIAKFYQSWRDKEYLDAILDSGIWLYFLPTLAYWAITKSETAKIFVLIGVVLLVLTQGRKKKNIFVKAFSGILSLYNIVGYFSDILSYARLLALGLATGVIAVIINQIAVLAGGMVPYVGWIIMILIIVLGHLFNLAINILGSYIHSSRLEFVEFFGKFMEGGGKAFKPFRKKFKYIKVG